MDDRAGYLSTHVALNVERIKHWESTYLLTTKWVSVNIRLQALAFSQGSVSIEKEVDVCSSMCCLTYNSTQNQPHSAT